MATTNHERVGKAMELLKAGLAPFARRELEDEWAHQQSFSSDDAYRALDSAGRLLAAVSAPEADEVEKMKLELPRVRYEGVGPSLRRAMAAECYVGPRLFTAPIRSRLGNSRFSQCGLQMESRGGHDSP